MITNVVSFLALAAWIALGLTRLPFMARPPTLPAAPAPADWPAVVAVIPARDEAATIGAVVGAHFHSTYPDALTVIVIDDHSTDGTAALAFDAAAGGASPPFRAFSLIEAPSLAEGWTGKLSAVNAGLSHSETIASDARYVLLTDADIEFAPETLTKLVAFAEQRGNALTSLMARLDARGFWGELLIPAFVFFFQKLYPFHRASDDRDRLAAAAGGCMLVRRDALVAIGGVAAIKGRLIDDCALAGAIKGAGYRLWLGLAKDEATSLRDNRSLASIWTMVERSAFAQLQFSWRQLVGAVAGMALLYLAPPLIALSYPFHRNVFAATMAAAAWALMAQLYWPTARLYGEARLKSLFLPAAAFLYTLMTISSAVKHARGRGGLWKGRTYPASPNA